MACEVVRDMSFLFGDLIVCLLEGIVFLHSEELIGVVTSHDNNVMISVVERAMKRLHVLSGADTLE
jgi:hypothetical protein